MIAKEEYMELTSTNVNGYLIPNLTCKSGKQMEQIGKYGFLSRDYLRKHRNSKYQIMIMQDTIGAHRTGGSDNQTIGRKRTLAG